MKSALLRGWNLSRIVRLALGVVILVQGIVSSEAVIVLLGASFTVLPLVNPGCSAVGGCCSPVEGEAGNCARPGAEE